MTQPTGGNGPSIEALHQAREWAPMLAQLGARAYVIEAMRHAVDEALKRREAQPVLRYVDGAVFEIGSTDETRQVTVPRAGAEIFAAAITFGVHRAQSLALDRHGNDPKRGDRMRKQRDELAAWLEVSGFRDVATAVRRIIVHVKSGDFSIRSPRS